jgi:hypothetical protein
MVRQVMLGLCYGGPSGEGMGKGWCGGLLGQERKSAIGPKAKVSTLPGFFFSLFHFFWFSILFSNPTQIPNLHLCP